MYDDVSSISLGGTPRLTARHDTRQLNQDSRTTFVIYSASLVYYVASHSRDASRAADSDAHVSGKVDDITKPLIFIHFLFFGVRCNNGDCSR